MEQVVINSEETTSSGPDDAALAAAGESAVNAGNTHSDSPPVTKARPEGIPEKFWNESTGEVDVEGLAKSYQELERSRSTPKEEPKQDLKIENVEQAKELAVSKGVDFAALEKEYLANGDLSEESYKSLADKGIPQEQVKQFVEGQKASAMVARQELLKDVGGEEAYGEVTAWAKEAMSPSEIETYNRIMATGDRGMMKLAIDALSSKFKLANGSPPKSLVGGKTSQAPSTEAFESRVQYVDAIKDPRYDRDPAYRDLVMRRLAASNIF